MKLSDVILLSCVHMCILVQMLLKLDPDPVKLLRYIIIFGMNLNHVAGKLFDWNPFSRSNNL